MTRERRQQARTEPVRLGFIQVGHDEGGRIRNVSEGGLCFETFAPIERERLVQFWFSLDLRERIEAKGRLAWLDRRGEIGGLQFVDLSPKGRRHLRTYLGAQLNMLPGRERVAVPSEPPGIHLLKGKTQGPRVKGSVFLAALAKYSLGQALDGAEASEGAASVAPGSNEAVDWRTGAVRASPDHSARRNQAGSTFWNPMSFVSLERHVTTSRHQLVRGVTVGAVISLAVGAVAGWYLGRDSARTEASHATLSAAASPSIPLTASMPPISEVSATAARPAASSAMATPSASSRPYVPDNPPPIGPPQVGRPMPSQYEPRRFERNALPYSSANASSPAASLSETRHAEQNGGTASRPGEAKSAKKSATPQQLWASVQAGNMKAAVELADRFIHGDGVPVNCDQARILLLVASEKNNADAIKKLSDLDKTGCPPQ